MRTEIVIALAPSAWLGGGMFGLNMMMMGMVIETLAQPTDFAGWCGHD
jgi:hypothetical protein